MFVSVDIVRLKDNLLLGLKRQWLLKFVAKRVGIQTRRVVPVLPVLHLRVPRGQCTASSPGRPLAHMFINM